MHHSHWIRICPARSQRPSFRTRHSYYVSREDGDSTHSAGHSSILPQVEKALAPPHRFLQDSAHYLRERFSAEKRDLMA